MKHPIISTPLLHLIANLLFQQKIKTKCYLLINNLLIRKLTNATNETQRQRRENITPIFRK